MKLPISQIQIGERQRIDLGDLSELDSMADPDVGLVQPIVVHKVLTGYELVAGRRRLAKAVELGWTEIEVVDKDQLTPMQKQLQEFVEDIARKDRSWQEKCLAVSKLHYMKKLDRAADGEDWTLKQTAVFTGIGKATLISMEKLADRLNAVPRDEEMWNAPNFMAGLQVIVNRGLAETTAEMERRRAVVNKQATLSLSEEYSESDVVLAREDFDEIMQVDVPTIIYIHGFNLDFEKADVEALLGTATVNSILMLGEPSNAMLNRVFKVLSPTGYALAWVPYGSHQEAFKRISNIEANAFKVMPWYLVWNKISMAEKINDWPFVQNMEVGILLTKEGERPMLDPLTSTMSCQPFENQVPQPLIDFSLKAICPTNMAVLCPANAPVVEVARTGRVPIWFEADPVAFAAKVAALTEYYKENVPNAIIEVRKS